MIKRYLPRKSSLNEVFLLIISLIITEQLVSQNLIKNGYLNDTIQLGGGQSLIPRYWGVATSSSPDYLNDWSPIVTHQYYNYNGTQYPKFREGYLGLVMYSARFHGVNVREYIQSVLSSPLEKDTVYCFRVWISLADSSNYALKNQLGVYFSTTKVDSSQIFQSLLHLNPQINFQSTSFLTDTARWLQYNAQYIANGGERYLVIGNFNPDSTLDTLRVFSGNDPSIYQITYYYLDGFWLSKCDSLPNDTLTALNEAINKEAAVSLYPNPSSGRLNLKSMSSIESIDLLDLRGRLVNRYVLPKESIQLPEKSGIYLLRIQMKSGDLIHKKVVRE